MLHLPLIVICILAQEPTKPFVAPGDDEELIRGLPEGDIAPLPDHIDWDLEKAVIAKTVMRERIDLGGVWRFAAVLEKESTTARSEMGWMKMPAVWTSEAATILDARFRSTDGLWRGRPLEKFTFAWIERDLVIRNEDALKWLRHRNFLVLRGPWADAEVFVSQRFKKDAADRGPNDPPQFHVHVEQVAGVDRDDGRWFEITEQLAYPASNQLSLRLALPARDVAGGSAASKKSADSAAPFVGIEMLPNGPRVDAVRLRRDAARGEIEATIDLLRPIGYMVLPGPPIKTIPMTLKLRLDDPARDMVVQKLDQEIGPIKDNTRRVVLRIPWSAMPGQVPPGKSRVRLRLESIDGGIFDEIHPIQFKPSELDPVN